MGPPIGRDPEDCKAKVLENLDEERVQWKPHSKLEIALGQCYMADLRSMRPLQVSRLNHLKTIHPRYPCTFVQCDRRFEVATANRYLFHFVIDLKWMQPPAQASCPLYPQDAK